MSEFTETPIIGAEEQWCQWVHLARLILANDLTREHMPDFYLPYDDSHHLYSGHHPACQKADQ